MGRVKIVFMIDAKPVTSNNTEFFTDYVAKQVRFSILRILTYFGGKHRLSGRKESLGPLWGYKFYKSSGGHLDYGSHHFFDLRLQDFERFEDELEEKLLNTKEVERYSMSDSVADRFSCALAEVVAGFQWERPDFFSPVKSGRKVGSKRNTPMISESDVSNFVFLFTPCPGCCGDTVYFPHGPPSSSAELQSALVKEEVSKKIMNDCRISFNWIDIGTSFGKDTSTFHDMLGAVMDNFSGTLVQVRDLSFWWVEKEDTAVLKGMQPGSFGCFMESLLCPKIESRNRSFSPKMSIDIFKLSLLINDTCTSPEASLVGTYLPLSLRSATIKGMPIQNEMGPHSLKESTIPNREQYSNLKLQGEVGNGRCNVAEITGVFKSSATLSLLQNCRESFYCSYDFSQSKDTDGRGSIALKIFQQLLKILKTKRLILVIQLNHPETGCLVNACFQPWTSLSGILTIMKPLFSGKDITKYLGTQSMRDQLKLLQGLIKNIQAKLDTARNNLDEKCSVDTEMMSDLKRQAKLSATSFMQSMDYWFMDLPSHALPSRLHHSISRMQDVDAGSFQNTNQRSAALFKRLKDFYKEKRYSGKTKEPEKEVTMLDDSLTDRRNLKTRTLSRSALLIENSKAVKMQRKSEDDIKENDKKAPGNQSEGNAIHSEDFDVNNDKDVGGVFTDILKHGQELSAITLEDLISYMKNEILTVLSQDAMSCQASAKRLSRNTVLCLNKLNENKDFEECVLPAQFLEKVFKEVASLTVDDKSVKILSYILRVSMDLEIAVLTKADTNNPREPKVVETSIIEHHRTSAILNQPSDSVETNCSSDDDVERVNPVAERVLEQLRPLVFLQDPSFIAKHLNTAILPRFKSKIPHILREIYEGLGQPVPTDIQSPSQKTRDADDSFEVINDSIIFSDYGSNNPSNQSGSGFRRFVSVSDSTALKRQIIVPAKAKVSGTKRQKKGYLPEITREAKSNKEGWCRNLFETNLNLDAEPPATGSKKRKISRPHSELTASVKDTPARKQRRHFFWKRQHKERRKTNGITDITVIGESPIKRCDDMQSTFRISAPSRFLSRSQSFSCKTSPRRFYAPRRGNKTNKDLQSFAEKKKFTRSLSCLPNTISHCSFKEGVHIGIGLDKVFYDDESAPKLSTRVSLSHDKDRDSLVITPRKRSLSIGTNSVPSTHLTPSVNFSLDNAAELENTDLSHNRANSLLDILDLANETSSFGFEATRVSGKPLLFSEDSMDWVAMFGSEKQRRENSPLPTIDSESSFRGSETDSLAGGSPTLSTPIREGKQPFSSPFLSASSLDTLENAPILSPRLRGSNSKRGLSCRKRIQVANDG